MATCRGRRKRPAPLSRASNNFDHKGNGGSIVANAVTLDVTTWKLNEKNRVAETTNSSTSGRATWLGTVTEADFECEVIFDSTALLITDDSVTPGTTITVRLNVGDSGKFYTGSAVVETVTHSNNNLQDVVKATVTGKYSGTLTQPIT